MIVSRYEQHATLPGRSSVIHVLEHVTASVDAGTPQCLVKPTMIQAPPSNDRPADTSGGVSGPSVSRLQEACKTFVDHAAELRRSVRIRDVLHVGPVQLGRAHCDEVQIVRRDFFEQQRIREPEARG